jgi:signal transduction histidine kinase
MFSQIYKSFLIILLVAMVLLKPTVAMADEDSNYKQNLQSYLRSNDQAKKVLLLDTITKYWLSRTPDSAMKYARLHYSLQLPREISIATIRSQMNLGEAYLFYSKMDSAVHYYRMAEKTAQELALVPVELTFFIYKNLASLYTYMGQYTFSTDYVIKALKLAEREKNEQWLKLAEIVYAENQAYTGNPREAANFYIQALKVKSADSTDDIKHFIYLANLYLQLKKPDSNVYYAERALSLAGKNTYYYYYARIAKVSGLMDLKRYKEVIKILNEDSNCIAFKNADLQYMSYSYFIRGNCHLGLKNYGEAIRFLNSGLKAATDGQFIDVVMQVYKALEQCYVETKQYQSAYIYTKKLSALTDSMFTIEKEKQISNLSSNFKLEKKQAELQKKQEELSWNRTLLWVTSFAIVIFLMLFVLLYRSNVKRKLLNTQLAELNTKKDRLFSVLSHDLRSPLSDLFHLLAAELNKLPENYDKSGLRLTQQRLSATLNMLDNLLHWSAGQIHGLNHSPTAFYIADALDDALSITGQAISARQINLRKEIDEEVMIYADQQMTTTVFRNLIQNAIKFSHEKGTLTIGTKEIDDHTLQCYIKDEGVGIHPNNLISILDGGTTTLGTRGERGTGVGLNLCKTFVEMNGGKIYIESKEGVGTTIFIELPLAL